MPWHDSIEDYKALEGVTITYGWTYATGALVVRVEHLDARGKSMGTATNYYDKLTGQEAADVICATSYDLIHPQMVLPFG